MSCLLSVGETKIRRHLGAFLSCLCALLSSPGRSGIPPAKVFVLGSFVVLVGWFGVLFFKEIEKKIKDPVSFLGHSLLLPHCPQLEKQCSPGWKLRDF